MSGRTVTPGRLHVDEEVGDAAVLRRIRVGAGEHEHPVGGMRAGGPDLLAVDDEVVAIADGASLEAGEVGAGAGLAVALAPAALRREGCAPRCSFFCSSLPWMMMVGPIMEVPMPPTFMRAGLGELLVHDELLHHAEAGAAVFLRPGGCDPTLGGELPAPFLHHLAAAHHHFLRRRIRVRLRLFSGEECGDFLAPFGFVWAVFEIQAGTLRFCSLVYEETLPTGNLDVKGRVFRFWIADFGFWIGLGAGGQCGSNPKIRIPKTISSAPVTTKTPPARRVVQPRSSSRSGSVEVARRTSKPPTARDTPESIIAMATVTNPEDNSIPARYANKTAATIFHAGGSRHSKGRSISDWGFRIANWGWQCAIVTNYGRRSAAAEVPGGG